jgi:acetyl-CoA acetyltransferase
MPLVALEDLDFCAKGEGGPFVGAKASRLLRDGEPPANTDGGGLSACHPGMRGLFLTVEAVRHLRRSYAPDRQVPGAPELALVTGTDGWFCSFGTLILRR